MVGRERGERKGSGEEGMEEEGITPPPGFSSNIRQWGRRIRRCFASDCLQAVRSRREAVVNLAATRGSSTCAGQPGAFCPFI